MHERPRIGEAGIAHTTFAFFFNALIIVLTMNVIAKGHVFSALFAA